MSKRNDSPGLLVDEQPSLLAGAAKHHEIRMVLELSTPMDRLRWLVDTINMVLLLQEKVRGQRVKTQE